MFRIFLLAEEGAPERISQKFLEMNSKLTAALPAILLGGCLNIFVFPQNAYSAALAVTQSINLNGNAITTDSFDSYGTNLYDAAMARDNGDLLALTTNTVSLKMQSFEEQSMSAPEALLRLVRKVLLAIPVMSPIPQITGASSLVIFWITQTVQLLM